MSCGGCGFRKSPLNGRRTDPPCGARPAFGRSRKFLTSRPSSCRFNALCSYRCCISIIGDLRFPDCNSGTHTGRTWPGKCPTCHDSPLSTPGPAGPGTGKCSPATAPDHTYGALERRLYPCGQAGGMLHEVLPQTSFTLNLFLSDTRLNYRSDAPYPSLCRQTGRTGAA